MKQNYISWIALILLMSVFYVQDAKAQDPRFAQYYASPANLNPAMTGVFEGRFRAVLNYREQWSSILNNHPFRTMAASVELKYEVLRGDYIGFGVSVLHDDQAGSGRYSQSRGYLNVSYLKQLGGSKYSSDDQYLIAGAQVGMGQNSLDANKLWYSRQFNTDSGNPDSNLSSGENIMNAATDMFVDFNAGIMYYALFGDDMSVYFGGALNHLTAPNISLIDGGKDILYTRWVVHAGGELPFSPEFSILPSIAVMGQGPSLSISPGANLRYSNHDWRELAIRAGMWWHIAKNYSTGSLFDNLTFSAILEMDRWNIGVSYDINVSSLSKATNSRGAIELSLIYTHLTRDRYRMKCPKF